MLLSRRIAVGTLVAAVVVACDSASVAVEPIGPRALRVDITLESLVVSRSERLTLDAKVLTDSGPKVSPPSSFRWSSSDPSIATVSAEGEVTGVAAGAAYVFAEKPTTNIPRDSARVVVTVTCPAVMTLHQVQDSTGAAATLSGAAGTLRVITGIGSSECNQLDQVATLELVVVGSSGSSVIAGRAAGPFMSNESTTIAWDTRLMANGTYTLRVRLLAASGVERAVIVGPQVTVANP